MHVTLASSGLLALHHDPMKHGSWRTPTKQLGNAFAFCQSSGRKHG